MKSNVAAMVLNVIYKRYNNVYYMYIVSGFWRNTLNFPLLENDQSIQMQIENLA